MSADIMLDTVDDALRNLHEAERRWQRATEGLPSYPEQGCCETPELRVVTECLAQVCFAEKVDGGFIATTDGWDDMGDMDGPEHLTCLNCDGYFAVPDDLAWG
jgi:hypothetical protein